jgi:hypothetical protein
MDKLEAWYSSASYDSAPELAALRKHMPGKTIVVGDYGMIGLAKSLDVRGLRLGLLPYANGSVDTVISAWNDLPSKRGLDSQIAEWRRVLKRGGTLLIEEGNPASEYVGILRQICRYTPPNFTMLVQELKPFFDIKRESIESSYNFKDVDEFSQYFINELEIHQNQRIAPGTTQKLRSLAKLKVQELSSLLVCTKR